MNNIISIENFKTPFGDLILGAFDNKLCLADWKYRKMRKAIDNRIQTYLNASHKAESSSVIEETKSQLNEYFKGERKDFDLPLLMVGSKFQKNVWDTLLQIEYGTTKSYLELSKLLQNEKAIRAVASANGANAISIIIPCHRIIGSEGKLIGYAGGLSAKKKLLELEHAIPNKQLSIF
ncbi:MAG: methylated-DNA--[protein]-cysteine S-methyltransferase [Prolixibacteraceae bacterium]|jgi:methylated-DNA-[protein]-cysteine S-methyltransferase|nr:methylated-DNA--[protein]-cysteine S-methyltransferase [Prolixibacteraceae bacterium]